jgi:hypothetical protein
MFNDKITMSKVAGKLLTDMPPKGSGESNTVSSRIFLQILNRILKNTVFCGVGCSL